MAKSRASRKMNKRNKRSQRRHRGGAYALSPAGINDQTMFGPSNLASAQGQDYLRIHQGQYGGASHLLGAPVGDQGLLDPSLRAAAHLAPQDAALAASSGMSDQAGGKRSKPRSFKKFFRNSTRSFKRLFKGKTRRGKKSLSKMFRNSYRSTKKALSLNRLFRGKKGRKGKKSLSKMLGNSYRSTKKALSLKRFTKMLRMRGGAGYQYANQADYASPGTLLPPSMEAKALMGMNPEWRLDQASFVPK